MPIDYEAIGAQLREGRLQKKWTQRQVARKLSMTHQNVSLIEKGIVRTDIENIERYADLVGCRLTILLSRPGDERARLAGRLADILPLLGTDVFDTLSAWADLWERKYGAARRTA